MWDVETGLALTEWLNTGGSISDVCFDPTGQRIGAAARGGRVWVLPEPPMPVPGWFPGFAETVAGLRLEERGNVELVPRIELEQVTERLKGPFDLLRAGPGTNEFYARLGRWFLADPARRAQTPF